MPSLSDQLQSLQIPFVIRSGISVVHVEDANKGLDIGRLLVTSLVDTNTLLLLSGGRTPKELYTSLVQMNNLHIGAVSMIDERYGEKFHGESNETMLKDTGLVEALGKQHIPFYPVLQEHISREKTTEQFTKTLSYLYKKYSKRIGILGIGLDGHTAGIPANNHTVSLTDDSVYTTESLVTEYHDTTGMYKERITLTFPGLAQLTTYFVLVFGADKKNALHKVFTSGDEKEVPGRFFLRPEIAQKTILITDVS